MDRIVELNIKEIKSKIKIGRNAKLLVHSVSVFHKNTDALIKARLAEDKSLRFDCKKGCSTCCHLRVEALPPETFLIARHIGSLPEEDKAKIALKLEEHAKYAAGRTFVEYEKPCPFLSQDGACGIYDVRPHKCRKLLSKNVDTCKKTRDGEEDDRLKMLSNSLAIHTVNIYKSKHLVMHPAELGQSVLQAIKDPSIEERWANGEQVFPLLPERIML